MIWPRTITLIANIITIVCLGIAIFNLVRAGRHMKQAQRNLDELARIRKGLL